MTLAESISPTGSPTTAGSDQDDTRHHWDINDNTLPTIHSAEPYSDWSDGHCKAVYSETSEAARRHASGWAMRNTNNHKVEILKKSCLGVLVCSERCTLGNGDVIHIRPAICDKARRKQLGKSCHNSSCSGHLELQPCRGHCGYPVTHFWRHVDSLVFFQAKGVHDHARPDLKSSSDGRRSRDAHSLVFERTPGSRKRMSSEADITHSLYTNKLAHIDELSSHSVSKEMVCSCPPFECLCAASSPTTSPALHHTTQPSFTSSGSLDYRVLDQMRRDHVANNRPKSQYGCARRRKDLEPDDHQLGDVDFGKACSQFTTSFSPCMSPPLKVDTSRPNCMYSERPSSSHNVYLPPSHQALNACYESKVEAHGTPMYSASAEAVVSRCTLSDFEITRTFDTLDPRTGQTDALLRLASASDDLDYTMLNLPSITAFLDESDAAKTQSVKLPTDSTTVNRHCANSSAKTSAALTRTKPITPLSLVELKPMGFCKKSYVAPEGVRPVPGEGRGSVPWWQCGSSCRHLVNSSGKDPHTGCFQTYGIYHEDGPRYTRTTPAPGAHQNHSINITVSYT